MLTHASLHRPRAAAAEMEGLGDDDVVLAYLPPAWIGQNIFSYAQAFVTGYCICCPESAETVMTDMREIGPTYYFAPPRVLEALLTQVSIRMEDAARAQALAVPLLHGRREPRRRRAPRRQAGRRCSIDCSTALGDLLVYGPLRNVLGMSRVRIAYTAGEAIGPDLFRFYRSIGINLKQLYGSTETACSSASSPTAQVKRRHGRARRCKGVELRFTPGARAADPLAGPVQEYYKNPQATRRGEGRRGLVPHRRRRLLRRRTATSRSSTA